MKVSIKFWLPVAMLVLPVCLSAQDEIFASEEWQAFTEKELLVEFFEDFFLDLGVRVRETGEEVTVKHLGDRFEIVQGINEDQVSFVIEIGTQNIRNFVGHAQDGELNQAEAYAVIAIMFTPVTAKTLQREEMIRNIPRFVRKRDSNIHVTLQNPDGTESVSHTILYVNDEWIVVPGLYGTPKRVYLLGVEDAMLYQQQVQDALQTNTRKGWKAFKKWYKSWRAEVSAMPTS